MIPANPTPEPAPARWHHSPDAPSDSELVDALAFALARAQIPGDFDTSRDYAERLAPLVIESGYLRAAARVSGDPQTDEACIGDPSHQYHSHDDDPVEAAAIPADPADWTTLANDIRIVDGNHDLGAGELASRLVERGWRKAAGDPAGLDVERLAEAIRRHRPPTDRTWNRADPRDAPLIAAEYAALTPRDPA